MIPAAFFKGQRVRVGIASGVAAALLCACGPGAKTASNAQADNAAALSDTPPKLPPQGDITGDMLVAYARAKLAFKPKDEFTKSFDDSALVGRTFRLKIAQRSSAFDSAFSANYDADKETLRLAVLPSSASTKRDEHDYGPDFDYLPIVSSETIGPAMEMENAFGVKTEGHLVVGSATGVGSYGGDHMGAIAVDRYSSKDRTMYKIMEKLIKMPPDQARRTVSDIWLEVQGEVRQPSEKDAHTIQCAENTKKATMSYNYEERWSQCVISAKLSRVAIVSKTGGVMAEWK